MHIHKTFAEHSKNMVPNTGETKGSHYEWALANKTWQKMATLNKNEMA